MAAHETAQQILDYFSRIKGYHIGPPASIDDIKHVEDQLGHQLPPILKEMYSRFNELVTPENVVYLGLIDDESMNSIYYTKILHTYFEGIDLTSYVGFGMNSKQEILASTWSGDRFIAYQGYMEAPEDLGTDLFKIFLDDAQWVNDVRAKRFERPLSG